MGYKVYYLSDPRIGKPRYYGVTKSTLNKRLRNHYSKGYNLNPKDEWIEELNTQSIKVDITEIAEYEYRETALKLETSLIINGKDLFNLIAGEGYRNPYFNERYLKKSIEAKDLKILRESKYGKQTWSKPNKIKPEKPCKVRRKIILTDEQRNKRIECLRNYWFKRKNTNL